MKKNWIAGTLVAMMVLAMGSWWVSHKRQMDVHEQLVKSLAQRPEELYATEAGVQDMLAKLAVELNSKLPTEEMGIEVAACGFDAQRRTLQHTYIIYGTTPEEVQAAASDLRHERLSSAIETYTAMRPLIEGMDRYGYTFTTLFLNERGDTLLVIEIEPEEILYQ